MVTMENAREEYKVVYQRISYYKNNSYDISFHNYLDSVILEVANSARTPEEFLADLDANYQKYLSVVASQNKEKVNERNKKLEYSLGVGVLSVFGIAFILYGIFSFGKEFITDAVLMGILYALSAGVIVFAQLVLFKKHESICHLVTCIGFSLAYFTTFYSYVNKELFSQVIACILLAVISLIAMILNRFRQSELVEIVVGLGVGCLALPFVREGRELTFVLFSSLIALVNLAFYIVNAKHSGAVSKNIRTITMALAGLCLIASYDYSFINFWYKGGLCAAFALVFAIAYMVNSKDNSIKYTCLSAMGLFCLFLVNRKDKDLVPFLASIAAVAVISLILSIYNRRSEEKWIGYIVFVSFLALKAVTYNNETVTILMIFATMLISKLLLYTESETLCVFDCVLTGFSLFATLYYYDNPLVYAIAVVAVVGCFIAKKFRLYHVIFTCIAMICFSFLNDALWLSISFMLVALLLIGYGCYINKFEVRLSGLILSLVVCIKVALFDFRKADDFRRLIVFLVVGSIAIGISILYLYLEKRERKENSLAENTSEGDNLDA